MIMNIKEVILQVNENSRGVVCELNGKDRVMFINDELQDEAKEALLTGRLKSGYLSKVFTGFNSSEEYKISLKFIAGEDVERNELLASPIFKRFAMAIDLEDLIKKDNEFIIKAREEEKDRINSSNSDDSKLRREMLLTMAQEGPIRHATEHEDTIDLDKLKDNFIYNLIPNSMKDKSKSVKENVEYYILRYID